jgi:hypothetical protein
MRKILTTLSLLLVVAAFGLFTIFVLLYAQGKTFDGSTGIVQTGIIRVNSNPKDVSVYINEEERSLVESKIDALQPGKVSLTLRKDGYYDWTKEVLVEPGVLKDIFAQMIPKTIELSDVTTDDITLFIPSNINEFIYYVSEDSNQYTLKKIKVRRDFLDFSTAAPSDIRILVNSEYELLSSSAILEVSSDNSKLLFANNSLNSTGYVDLNNGQFTYITEGLPTVVNKEVSWFMNSDSVLITSEANLTYEYNLDTGLSIIVTNAPTDIFKADSYAIFKTASKVSLYENERITPLVLNEAINAATLNSTTIYPALSNPEIFTIQNANKSIALYDLDKNLSISANISGDILYSSSDATHFIVKNELGVYSVSFEYSIATRTYKLSEGTLLTETVNSSDVLKYSFYNNNKNILYTTQSQIFTSDLDGANFREITIPEGYQVVEANITSDNQFIYTVLKDAETNLIKIYKINTLLK